MTSQLLRNVEVGGRLADVLLLGDRVYTIRPPGTTMRGYEHDAVMDGRGGVLLPGLHDHHLHLLALAAARSSVDCGAGLSELRRVRADDWIRGTNYHESTDGVVDRHVLDQLVNDRPVRVQHRSGALWMLNSEALRRVAGYLDRSADVERDDAGEPNGRLWRYDTRLRGAIPLLFHDLSAIGSELATLGITGVTDATPDLDDDAISLLSSLPQWVTVLGSANNARLPVGMVAGPRKLLLRDHDLPSYEAIAHTIRVHHADGRGVAVHCVTREALVLTLAALDETGAHPQDRIEHGAIVPHDLVGWMRRLGVTVVTQPDFLRTRGASYLQEIPAHDIQDLYPHARLLAAGVPTVASSDAPYGTLDPWQVIRTASDRPLAAAENVDTRQALDGYLTSALDPGGPVRKVTSGTIADLVLLHVPLSEALRAPEAGLVRATWVAGARL